jgi:PHD/YefM family antitoxin component YafN of YafNO toxin-antitoxin module
LSQIIEIIIIILIVIAIMINISSNLVHNISKERCNMKINKEGIVSNSDMIKNYKACREKVEQTGKLYIFKNNKLDAVLFSLSEFEDLTPILEYFEKLSEEDKATALKMLRSVTLPQTIKNIDID